jgi:ribosomal protein L12E/L44/L45/RPP1/RPP2
MKHLATYLLLKLGGNDAPSADDITKALATVGVEVDSANLTKMMADLEGKDLTELMASGKDMLATFGGGGGGGGGGAGGDAGGAAPAVEEVAEEEEADVGGGNLFGDDEAGDGDY